METIRPGSALAGFIMRALIPMQFLIGCAPSLAQYKEIGARGSIDTGASVRGFASVDIRAPIQDVWKTLIQAKAWPEWNGDIKSVKVDGVLDAGITFVWGPAFPRIKSEVVLCIPERRLLWVGTMLHFKAIHAWKLEEKDGLTTVSTEESLHGSMITWIFGRKKLDDNLKNWLVFLKQRVEREALSRTHRMAAVAPGDADPDKAYLSAGTGRATPGRGSR